MQILTVTRNRPKAFEQLKTFVKKQENQDYEWTIVCDGGYDDYVWPKGNKIKVINRDPAEDTMPSLCHNLLTALEHVNQDRVCVMEDDDWYHPSYLNEMNKMLEKADLVGFGENAYYYVLERKAQRRHNNQLAALATTGWKKKVNTDVALAAHQGSVHIDSILWQGFKGKKLLINNFTGLEIGGRIPYKLDKEGNVFNEQPRHVGMKQNWHGGDDGLTQQTSGGGIDQTGKVLKGWLGQDSAFYLKFTREQDQSKPQPFILIEMPNNN